MKRVATIAASQQAQEHMRKACKPGDLIRINAPQATMFCDYNKQIVQEGQGVVSCTMRP